MTLREQLEDINNELLVLNTKANTEYETNGNTDYLNRLEEKITKVKKEKYQIIDAIEREGR